jgi:hypothetical protein
VFRFFSGAIYREPGSYLKERTLRVIATDDLIQKKLNCWHQIGGKSQIAARSLPRTAAAASDAFKCGNFSTKAEQRGNFVWIQESETIIILYYSFSREHGTLQQTVSKFDIFSDTSGAPPSISSRANTIFISASRFPHLAESASRNDSTIKSALLLYLSKIPQGQGNH